MQPHPHNFQLAPRNFVTVYRRNLQGIDVTIAPDAGDPAVLVLRVQKGEEVCSYRPWEQLPAGFSASDLVLAWIDPVKRGELGFRQLDDRCFIEPSAQELELAKRFLGQKPGGAVPPAS